MADLHRSLKAERVSECASHSTAFKLMKLHHGKTSIEYSVHAEPRSYSLSRGPHTTDLLVLCGFRRSTCSFWGRECFARLVPEGFDLKAFADSFEQAYVQLKTAGGLLETCGIFRSWPEGLAFFGRGNASPPHHFANDLIGDGHVCDKSDELKRVDDDRFEYVLTWSARGHTRGWVTHIAPKAPLLPPEMVAALDFLKLGKFRECRWHEFEPCYWRFIEASDDLGIDRAGFAHKTVTDSAKNFPQALEAIVGVHELLNPFGMEILSVPRPKPKPAPTPIARTKGFASKLVYRLQKKVSGKLALAKSEEPHVLIAHDEVDALQATVLHKQLVDMGCRVWCRAVDLQPGDLWDEVLPKRLDEADVTLMLVSGELGWLAKSQIARLINRVQENRRKSVVPVLLDGAKKHLLPFGLERVQPVEAYRGDFSKVLQYMESRRNQR